MAIPEIHLLQTQCLKLPQIHGVCFQVSVYIFKHCIDTKVYPLLCVLNMTVYSLILHKWEGNHCGIYALVWHGKMEISSLIRAQFITAFVIFYISIHFIFSKFYSLRRKILRRCLWYLFCPMYSHNQQASTD